jgi:protein tyrosine/serine phosphatase
MGGLLLACAVLASSCLGYRILSGNFHTVVAGELYRSAQVTPTRLEAYQRLHGIRTVINLRGAKPQAAWYRDEVAAADQLGIVHIDFRMSARRPLSMDQAHALLALLKTAPKPILVHCESGADRSGLAAALYLAGIYGAGAREAQRQLSIRFGHIGIPYISRAYAMDESWAAFEPYRKSFVAQFADARIGQRSPPGQPGGE